MRGLNSLLSALVVASPLLLAGCPGQTSGPSPEEQKQYEQMTKEMYEQQTKKGMQKYGPGYPGMERAGQQMPTQEPEAKPAAKP